MTQEVHVDVPGLGLKKSHQQLDWQGRSPLEFSWVLISSSSLNGSATFVRKQNGQQYPSPPDLFATVPVSVKHEWKQRQYRRPTNTTYTHTLQTQTHTHTHTHTTHKCEYHLHIYRMFLCSSIMHHSPSLQLCIMFHHIHHAIDHSYIYSTCIARLQYIPTMCTISKCTSIGTFGLNNNNSMELQ